MNDSMIKNVKKYTLLVAIIISFISYMFIRDIDVVLGVMIGSILRLASLNMIIRMVNNIERYDNPKAKGTSNYGVRMVLYVLVIGLAILADINIIGLTIGLFIFDIVILVLNVKGGAL